MRCTDKELLYMIDVIAKYLDELYKLGMDESESYRIGFNLQQRLYADFKDRQLAGYIEEELNYVGR